MNILDQKEEEKRKREKKEAPNIVWLFLLDTDVIIVSLKHTRTMITISVHESVQSDLMDAYALYL